MSITSLLETLTKDQLIFTIERAKVLLEIKQNEQTKIVWKVEDRWSVIRCFREENYLDAVEYLAKKAKMNHVLFKSPDNKEFSIVHERVLESEYENWFTEI